MKYFKLFFVSGYKLAKINEQPQVYNVKLAAGKFYGLSNSTLRNERIIRKYGNAECFHIAVLLPG